MKWRILYRAVGITIVALLGSVVAGFVLALVAGVVLAHPTATAVTVLVVGFCSVVLSVALELSEGEAP